MRSPQPLNRHLIRAALLATLVPLLMMVALGLWQYKEDAGRIERFTGEESLSAARVVSNVLDFLVEDTRHTLERVVHSAEQGHLGEGALAFEADSQPQTEGIAVTDAAGRIRMSTFGERGRDVSDLSVFSAVRDGQTMAYSDVFFSQWLKGSAVMLAMPYKVKGRFAGMVLARLNLPVLQKLLTARLDDPRLRSTFVVDREGNLISHYDRALLAQNRNLSASLPVKAALAGNSGWMRNLSVIDDSPRISGYMPMPGTGWAVVSTRKPGESVLGIEDRLRAQLALSLVAAMGVGMLAWGWGRRLAAPLEALETTFRRGPTAAGAVDVPLSPAHVRSRVAEYQTLAEGYNRMAAELNGRFDEILALKNRLQAQNLELNIRNDELAMLTNEAQAVNRLKDQFLATMSHELRTPLNSIIGFTELALTDLDHPLGDEDRVNHEIVLKSARHLLTLINDVLDLSKVEAGRMPLFVTAFSPEALVQSVMSAAMPAALTQHAELSLSPVPEIGEVSSDETKVRQILLNVVANAVKFSPGGRVTVSLEAPDADHWAVRVADTGIGIAPEHHELVFEEFRQVDGGPTRSAGGTGLGLSIARKLARLLGGDLTLDSEVGEGSTFTLTLPRAVPGAPVADAPGGHAIAAGHSSRSERLVLVVDDDEATRHLIVERLRDTLNRPIPAGSREAALKLAQERRPEAVILDVKLRRQDDWDILRDLRDGAETAAIPVVVVSFEENRAQAHALGAAAFVTKPVDRRQLLAAIDLATQPVAAS